MNLINNKSHIYQYIKTIKFSKSKVNVRIKIDYQNKDFINIFNSLNNEFEFSKIKLCENDIIKIKGIKRKISQDLTLLIEEVIKKNMMIFKGKNFSLFVDVINNNLKKNSFSIDKSWSNRGTINLNNLKILILSSSFYNKDEFRTKLYQTILHELAHFYDKKYNVDIEKELRKLTKGKIDDPIDETLFSFLTILDYLKAEGFANFIGLLNEQYHFNKLSLCKINLQSRSYNNYLSLLENKFHQTGKYIIKNYDELLVYYQDGMLHFLGGKAFVFMFLAKYYPKVIFSSGLLDLKKFNSIMRENSYDITQFYENINNYKDYELRDRKKIGNSSEEFCYILDDKKRLERNIEVFLKRITKLDYIKFIKEYNKLCRLVGVVSFFNTKYINELIRNARKDKK